MYPPGNAKTTPATLLAEDILRELQPLIDEAAEGRGYHTMKRVSVYMAGYEDCIHAVRDAVIRAVEEGVFEAEIIAGKIPRWRAEPPERERRAA